MVSIEEMVGSREIGNVVGRAVHNRNETATIPETEYYPMDTDVDIDNEISRISELEKTSENIHRLENLKRIRTNRRWIGKWFENDARKDCRQFVRYTNPIWYWPWHPETVIVDTTFIDISEDGTATVKVFCGHPLLIDHTESHLSEVRGKIMLNRIDRWLNNPSETVRFDRLM